MNDYILSMRITRYQIINYTNIEGFPKGAIAPIIQTWITTDMIEVRIGFI